MPQLYLAHIPTLADEQAEALRLVTPSRRETIERMKNRPEALRRLGAGLLLRQVLGVTRDDQLCYGPWGKPELAAGGLHFSLSHSGDYALLAVDSAPLGADLEQLRPFPDSVAKRAFSPAEQAWAAADDERRFALWTRKESLMKATGQGLTLAARDLDALPGTEGCTLGGQTWYLTSRTYCGHMLALAASRRGAGALTVVTAAVLLSR